MSDTHGNGRAKSGANGDGRALSGSNGNGARGGPVADVRRNHRTRQWEDLLTLIVDPESPRVTDPAGARAALAYLLAREGVDEARFWALERGRRSRLFLERFSGASRDLPQLELTAFDIGKLLKERFRREPLTLGAAWHYGYWRSYFSHAAITHPANDGLREEFSTAWDIVRKQPAVVFRTATGLRMEPLRSLRLDMPILVGPLPFDDGLTMERAYLEAIAAADPAFDLKTRTLVCVEADRWVRGGAGLLQFAEHVLLRLEPRHLEDLQAGGALADAVRAARIVELAPRLECAPADLESLAAAALELNPELLLGVYLRHPGGAVAPVLTGANPSTADAAGTARAGVAATADPATPGASVEAGDAAFWAAVETAAQHPGVALLQVHSGPLKSYRLVPRLDAFLKSRLLRARVQLVSASGDSDTLASAAGVYEAVLLGANGGAMTHAAAIALAPEAVDVVLGAAAPETVSAALARTSPEDLYEMASCTLSCWQHSVLDFLSCMGIDDVQKTSGNTMAITVTADWVREVDALATAEFGRLNEETNRARVTAEPVPPAVRDRYRVSSLLDHVEPDLPLVNAARVLAQRDASYHTDNSSVALTADFLEVIYRMAAGELPGEDDFLMTGGQGVYSLDSVGLKLSRASLAWSLARLRRDPALLDYVSLAVPRGFTRPGAVAPRAVVTLHAEPGRPALARLQADECGGFERRFGPGHPLASALEGNESVWLRASGGDGAAPAASTQAGVAPDASESAEALIELVSSGHAAHGATVVRASVDGSVTLRRDPRGGLVVSGFGFREPIWHAPVSHASTSLGAASEDFLTARIQGNAGLAMTSSGEGGLIRLSSAEDMKWESLQAASGHFGITGDDLRRVRDVEIKINQGAKPGKGGRLAGAKVTPTVSKARNIPVGTDALSPDPKHDIYSIEDMPAEVWLWLLYHNHCGIKITGSNYTRYVAAGMWSNFVVDYLLVDAGTGGSGNYHADSSHVGWPDAFRTILHTHHALMNERVDLDGSGHLRTIRDLNGAPFGAKGGTRLFASGGLRGELDMLKVLLAGADGLLEASIGKAVAFGCNQCGNCHLDCPRGGITTKPELMVQNDPALMRRRLRNWTALNMVKLALLVDALNRESGVLDDDGRVVRPEALINDIRLLRGRTDLLEMQDWGAQGDGAVSAAVSGGTDAPGVAATAKVSASTQHDPLAGAESNLQVEGSSCEEEPAEEHDSCRVGSLAVSEPVTVDAIWEAARCSYNGGNNRGGGIDFAGFAPPPVREKTCIMLNTIGPDRAQTIREMLGHLGGCRFFAADGGELAATAVLEHLDDFRLPVRAAYAAEAGWRRADLREDPGDFHLFFVDIQPRVLARYARRLIASPHWLQLRTKYADLPVAEIEATLARLGAGLASGGDGRADPAGAAARAGAGSAAAGPVEGRAAAFLQDVREEYFTVLAHVLDSRFYRTHGDAAAAPTAARKYAAKRRGYVVSMGEDLAAVKISGWTHVIPEYFDFERFWAAYPGTLVEGGVPVTVGGRDAVTPALYAHVWGMHHRYPTNSPAIDAEGRGNPAGAHPFKAYNVLLMHNGEQVGVDSTSPFLREYGYVHTDESMGEAYDLYEGDSVYDRKALTDTEYAAYLVDFTRRVLGLTTEQATQVISPITGLDLDGMPEETQRLFRLLALNYVQLTPTGPYKFTIVESRPGGGAGAGVGAQMRGGLATPARRVGFRENMDIKFLRPHELVVSQDTAPGGVTAIANGSEAKIADAMLRVLHHQGLLADASHDLRFNMRPGGNPGRGEFGGVVEAFLATGEASRAAGANEQADASGAGEQSGDAVKAGRNIELTNRFGETVRVERAGVKIDAGRPLTQIAPRELWRREADVLLDELAAELPQACAAAQPGAASAAQPAAAGGAPRGRFLGPDEPLPAVAERLVATTLERLVVLDGDDYRYLVDAALPGFAARGEAERAAAIRVLAELRKRVRFTDLGGKALSSIEYLTDGGRAADGSPEGGLYRILDAVPPLAHALAAPPGPVGRWGRLTLATRDDLLPPTDGRSDVLVLDLGGFLSEAFTLDCAARIVSEAVRLGWRNLIGYGCNGGPRYLGTNLAAADGTPATGVTIELFGREVGDFLGSVLEGAEVWLYGQGQSHTGMKAGSGYIFVLQDALNTCCYAAHGGTFSVWDSGSRFAVAGQNKVLLDDGETPAQGFRSVHFGTPNEYAFEYLMSGGPNSLHVVMGLAKPDARGELSLRARPYLGKFFMSGAAAGRVFVFDPERRLDPEQYRGNVPEAIAPEVWAGDLAPFLAREVARRGVPIRIEGEEIAVRLQSEWRRWRYDEAFVQLVPRTVARKLVKRGVTPRQLEQMVEE